MNNVRSASAHMPRKARKKSGKKKEDPCSQTFRRGSLCSQVDRYHHTSFPLVMDLPMSDDEVVDCEMPLATSCSKSSHFPFEQLPQLCILRIWSFLKSCDLGRCMLVCRDWYQYAQLPQLWSAIRFSELPFTCLPHDRPGPVHTEPVCHHCFRKRVFGFSQFLSCICPVVHTFQFCLDISHPTDQFNSVIEQFMAKAVLTSLRYADMNWKESPSRASLRGGQESVQEYMYRYRKRQRMFCKMFDTFTNLALQLTTLVMPFDWSEKSIENLCSLSKLENLVLEKYGIYNHVFTQDNMNIVMTRLVNLKKLLLEVWIPTCNSKGMAVFYVESTSLTFLDVSQCRGFYLRRLKTPNLLQLRIARRPWHRAFTLQQRSPYLPCMCSVLSEGAPNLKDINGLHLETGDSLYQSLEDCKSLMATICCCSRHRRSSGIEMYGM